MIACRTSRTRLTAPVAGLLLLSQGIGGGAVALAHAAERTTAPAAIEAQHSAQCPVLHLAVTCPQCQYAGAPAAVVAPRTAQGDRRAARPPVATAAVRRPTADALRAASPRAPPTPHA